MKHPLDILVLAGGPDRERPVSLKSGAQVAAALRAAGHRVAEADAGPNDLSAAQRFNDNFRGGGVVFPAMHGAWGEGGPLQAELERIGVKFVGCRPAAAALCMDKLATKDALAAAGVPTMEYERVGREALPTLRPPVVLKAAREGSSFGLHICRTEEEVKRAHDALTREYDAVLAERFVDGPEVTVGVLQLDPQAPPVALPLIRIEPATEYYDYEAKYARDDTRYLFGADTQLSSEVIARAQAVSLRAFEALGCRHLARVDLMVDGSGPLVMEVNTMPGFTDHSLLPMAAREHGLAMPALVDALVRAAAESG